VLIKRKAVAAISKGSQPPSANFSILAQKNISSTNTMKLNVAVIKR
jgi:hypothetical protein